MRPAMKLVTAALVLGFAAPLAAEELAVAPEGVALGGVPLRLALMVPGESEDDPVEVTIEIAGSPVHRTALPPGEATLTLEQVRLRPGLHQLSAVAAGERVEASLRVLPGWLSLVPPILAIGLALAFKDVLISLFLGIYAGALILVSGNPLAAFGRSIDHFVRSSLADADHAAILCFSLLLGGMVGVISRSGGVQGIVASLSAFATSVRRGQVATWLMGMAVFFDDYANTLIVGPTMRPIADRLRMSREKLAYIVDSTAAPIASLVPISTWIGYEVGLIATALRQVELEQLNPYGVFVASIPYRFYPILALVLVLTVALSGRDAGPMLVAERRARRTGQVIAPGDIPLSDPTATALAPPPGVTPRARNAVLPILTVICVTLAGLWMTGSAEVGAEAADGGRLRAVFGAADSFSALLWASLAGVVVAVVLGALQPGLALRDTMGGLVEGFRSMLLALVVLVLAWSLGQVATDLHTAEYLRQLVDGVLAPQLVPALVFILAAAIAFATGTSWATMAILIPIVVPVIHRLALGAGLEPMTSGYQALLLGTISSVLAGSVWGDHCSPISDTTVLSSMATGCDHIAHVRTQLPYALGIGILGLVVGDLPTAFGLSPWISLAVGTGVIVLTVRYLFPRVGNDHHATGAAPPQP